MDFAKVLTNSCRNKEICTSSFLVNIKVYVCTKWRQSLNLLSIVFVSCCLGAFTVSKKKNCIKFIYSTISMLMCRHSIDKFTGQYVYVIVIIQIFSGLQKQLGNLLCIYPSSEFFKHYGKVHTLNTPKYWQKLTSLGKMSQVSKYIS